MGLTLDTNVLIDLLRGAPNVIARLDELEASGELPILSTVAIFEVLSGVEYSQSRSERARVETLLAQIPLEDFDVGCARKAAEIRAELQRLGRPPAVADIMIAGHALSEGHTLVTRDRKLVRVARALGLRVVAIDEVESPLKD